MLRAILISSVVSVSAVAYAGGPEYQDDPFGDSDFTGAPLVLDVAHPTRGRAELGLLFASSLIGKYNSHMGGMLDLNYHLVDTLGVALTFGYLHGQLTQIVTDAEGIIGNSVEKCRKNPGGEECLPDKINPQVPDLRQITGVATASLVWSPLYGKINVVSELDVNLQIYGIFGVGINGTRMVQVQAQNPTNALDYQLVGGGVGEGGPFSEPEVHLNLGAGLRVFLTDWVDLRLEIRDLMFWDSFVFNTRTGTAETYRSDHFFAQAGLGFVLF